MGSELVCGEGKTFQGWRQTSQVVSPSRVSPDHPQFRIPQLERRVLENRATLQNYSINDSLHQKVGQLDAIRPMDVHFGDPGSTRYRAEVQPAAMKREEPT